MNTSTSLSWTALVRGHAREHQFAAFGLGLGLLAGFALMMVLDTTLG